MADKKFPMPLYNKDGAMISANNEPEFQKLKAKGYGPKYVHSHFPKFVFSPKGEQVLITPEEGEARLTDLLSQGYSEDFVAPVAPKEPLPKIAAPDDSGTVRALLNEIHDMKNRQDDLEIRIEDVEKAYAALSTEIPGSAKKAGSAKKEPKVDTHQHPTQA